MAVAMDSCGVHIRPLNGIKRRNDRGVGPGRDLQGHARVRMPSTSFCRCFHTLLPWGP